MSENVPPPPPPPHPPSEPGAPYAPYPPHGAYQRPPGAYGQPAPDGHEDWPVEPYAPPGPADQHASTGPRAPYPDGDPGQAPTAYDAYGHQDPGQTPTAYDTYPHPDPGQTPTAYDAYAHPDPHSPDAHGPYEQPAYGSYEQPAHGPYAAQPPQPPAGYAAYPAPASPATAPYPHPYVYPPMAPGAAADPGTPTGKRPGTRRRTLIAAVTAGLLVLGGGTYLVLGGGDDEGRQETARESAEGSREAGKNGDSAPPDRGDGTGTGGGPEADPGALNKTRAPGEARILFLAQNDTDLPRGGAEVFGPWVVGARGDTVAKAMYKEVVGYSATDGRKKWSVPLDAEVCSAPARPTEDGRIVIGVKDGPTDRAKCLGLRMIDLTTGKAGWKRSIPKATGFAGLADHTLTISGDTVAAGGTGSSYGFSIDDGRQLFAGPASGCKPFAFAGGPRLLAAAACPTGDYSRPKHQLSEVDPVTGKARWKYRAPEGWEIDKVYSTRPAVIALTQRAAKRWSVVALDANGRQRSQIDGGKDRFQPRCGGAFVVFGQVLEGCSGVTVDSSGGDTLYMATEPARPGGPNEVVAFDLDTGKATWRSRSGGEQPMVPLAVQDGQVIVYQRPSYDRGGVVAAVPAKGGPPRPLLHLPDAAARVESTFWSPRTVWADGRLYLASGRVSARSDEEELRVKTLMGFGK
ncbi:PQQ-binding-like beta-propeller repeat protein [Streptomyces sp. NPDC057638]|uniref:outer membrane protein assembly factor BamB family protein n=1 Tax=Streptomyces sp. NPDC057638 TaxID=3346190 RepID=UPI0036A04E6D